MLHFARQSLKGGQSFSVIWWSSTHLRLSLCYVTVQQLLSALLHSQLQFVDVRLQLLSRVHIELHQALMKLIQQAIFQQLLYAQESRVTVQHTPAVF